jgi:hypothetical protein
MISKTIKNFAWTLVFAGVSNAAWLIPSAVAQQSAADALQKARVLERMSEGMAVEKKGSSPGFVLDPCLASTAA